MAVVDALGRPVRDLRISVTDRCNFRCVYCMPSEVFGRDYRFLPRRELLTFEEIERVARVFVELGVRRVIAQCFADNLASWRLMERLGMRRETHTVKESLHRSGQWLDGLAYALLAEEWRAQQG